MLPYLSLVLAVRNERKMLPGLIDQLLEQNYPPEFFEILVVDGDSNDGTADLIRRRYSDRRVRIRVLDSPQRSVSAGRNVGIRAASGDAIVFLSGHCRIPSKNLLADTAEILETTGAGCLCRPQPLAVPAETRMGEAIATRDPAASAAGPSVRKWPVMSILQALRAPIAAASSIGLGSSMRASTPAQASISMKESGKPASAPTTIPAWPLMSNLRKNCAVF